MQVIIQFDIGIHPEAKECAHMRAHPAWKVSRCREEKKRRFVKEELNEEYKIKKLDYLLHYFYWTICYSVIHIFTKDFFLQCKTIFIT